MALESSPCLVAGGGLYQQGGSTAWNHNLLLSLERSGCLKCWEDGSHCLHGFSACSANLYHCEFVQKAGDGQTSCCDNFSLRQLMHKALPVLFRQWKDWRLGNTVVFTTQVRDFVCFNLWVQRALNS